MRAQSYNEPLVPRIVAFPSLQFTPVQEFPRKNLFHGKDAHTRAIRVELFSGALKK